MDEIVKMLLEHGAMVDAQTPEGHTALHFAADRGHPDVVRRLLANGASRDIVCPDGTAEQMAKATGHPQTIEAFQE